MDNEDFGNNRLSLYATLLLPFRNQNPQVLPLVQQLLASNDKRLKYTTAMLLLRNGLALPDTTLTYFAALDEFRYELYNDLKTLGEQGLFPAAYKTQQLHAQSLLATYQAYGKPDTLVFLEKLPVQHGGAEAVVYFFKYKEKKEDNTWKLAAAGPYANDPTVMDPLWSREDDGESEINFTRLTGKKLAADTPVGEQVKKLLKQLQYSHRKSAVQFYEDDNPYGDELIQARF
ncbi:MAG: hypothetical protein M3Q06_07335, partial [Bacteroidota bacterium]|nr:hypothetical protein [Bacteroidota bacterium]